MYGMATMRLNPFGVREVSKPMISQRTMRLSLNPFGVREVSKLQAK